MEIMSEVSVKHIRNLLAFAKDMQFKELDGRLAIGFCQSYEYLLKLSNEIESEIKEVEEIDADN